MFSKLLLQMWYEAEREGDEMLIPMTQFVITILEIYYSEIFSQM